MAKKNYEEYAKSVQLALHAFRDKLTEIRQRAAEIKADPRFTDVGKEEWLKALALEVKSLKDEKSKEIRKYAEMFIEQYQIIHPESTERYSQEVANALKVIEMCGYDLTPETLRVALDPIKTSYSSLKMIRGVIEAKASANVPDRYSFEIITVLDEYMNSTPDIEEYNDILGQIQSVIDDPAICNASVSDYTDTTGYHALCLPDNMMKVGKAYEELSVLHPQAFNN